MLATYLAVASKAAHPVRGSDRCRREAAIKVGRLMNYACKEQAGGRALKKRGAVIMTCRMMKAYACMSTNPLQI